MLAKPAQTEGLTALSEESKMRPRHGSGVLL
jgi:hypothetical protein